MRLTLAVVAAAVTMGRLRGGRIRRLAAVRLRRVWLVGVALLLRLAVGAVASPAARQMLLAAAYGVVGAFLWGNRRLPGLPLVAAGWALNATVVLANGGMPVSAEAIAGAGGGASPTGTHLPLQPAHRLALLADILPVPVLGVVVSVGDLLLAVGVALLIVRLMTPQRDDGGRATGSWGARDAGGRP